MPQSPVVVAIVLNYNGGSAVLDCLRSLEKSRVPINVLVVDNHSTDNSLMGIRAQWPAIPLIRNEHNLGFAAGMNVGIRWALEQKADFIWLINNDATVLPETLETLLRVADRHPEQGLWSPVIYFPSGQPWFLRGAIQYWKTRVVHVPPSQSKSVYPSEFLTGCALFLSRSLIERIGLLDEGYFLYYEDADYSVRARRAGFRPTVVAQAKVLHAEASRDNPEKTYWLVRSGIRFFQTKSPWYWRPWIWLWLRLRRLKNSLEMHLNPSPLAREVRRAYTDASRESHA